MANFREMYYSLAGKVADAIELLTDASQATEEMYLASEEKPALELHDPQNTEE